MIRLTLQCERRGLIYHMFVHNCNACHLIERLSSHVCTKHAESDFMYGVYLMDGSISGILKSRDVDAEEHNA